MKIFPNFYKEKNLNKPFEYINAIKFENVYFY